MRILITGGTGTIGKALLKRFDSSHSIRVFSRDELKQAQLQTLYPNVDFMIGDVKDYQRIKQAMAGIDIVIHAAAMKRIEICEQ
jgi:FlaA1/EpsC-like NDP-sugar epimerase